MDTTKKNLNIDEEGSLDDHNLEETNVSVVDSDDEYADSATDNDNDDDVEDSVSDDGEEDVDDSVSDDGEEDVDDSVSDDESEKTNKKQIKPNDVTIMPSEIIQKFMDQDENSVDEYDDEEYVSDEEYVKFDNEVRENQILNHHNDLIQSNFDEISALTKLVRNKEGIIVDPLHKTMPILTKFERARILGLRAKQLANGADPFIKTGNNLIQNHIIAEMEMEQNVLPFIVCRPLPNGRKEYWKLQDLEQIDY
jgi:DNA-directed RNA polymerase I, II, and III subunit RPABC2